MNNALQIICQSCNKPMEFVRDDAKNIDAVCKCGSQFHVYEPNCGYRLACLASSKTKNELPGTGFPRDADEYFNKRLSVYNEPTPCNEPSLLEICLELHQNASGSADYLSAKQYGEYYYYLANKVENWKPGLEPFQRFDNAVLELAKATLEECNRYVVSEKVTGRAVFEEL